MSGFIKFNMFCINEELNKLLTNPFQNSYSLNQTIVGSILTRCFHSWISFVGLFQDRKEGKACLS